MQRPTHCADAASESNSDSGSDWDLEFESESEESHTSQMRSLASMHTPCPSSRRLGFMPRERLITHGCAGTAREPTRRHPGAGSELPQGGHGRELSGCWLRRLLAPGPRPSAAAHSLQI